MQLTFGAWLKKRRRVLDLTQDDLAARAYCSVNSIRKIEAGDLVPSKALALELAHALIIPSDIESEFVRFARTPDATAPEDEFRGLPPEPVEIASPPALKYFAPAALTTAIGRERDTNVVTKILRLPAARLITLTGAPGTGKTRLALQVAAELENEFDHGASFVPLAPISQPELVASAIAQALDLRESDLSPGAALRAFLRDKQLLLVLDNFEHLLDAAPLVTDLLANAPRLKVLATSREPLRVYGERELPLAPLAVPPLAPLPSLNELETFSAVQLFIERAQQVNVHFALTPDNAAAVARLCVELDGLPLAIEMAAARVKWESPQELLPRLEKRLEAFSGRTRDVEQRQRTLRGAMDWSYGLLDATGQCVLRHLGVFRGGFTPEAAHAVCVVPVEDALRMLVEKSLVKREGELKDAPRYTLLEMIREYGLEQLKAGDELAQARTRHADFFRGEVHAIWHEREYGTQGTWHGFETRDADNYRAALAWLEEKDLIAAVELASDLRTFWIDKGLGREGFAWLDRLLPFSVDSTAYARGLNTAAAIAGILGELDTEAHYAERARQVSIAQQQPVQLGDSLQTLGRVALFRGELERAEGYLLAARQQFQELGLHSHEAYALNNLGLIAKDRGDLEQAGSYHQAALELRRGLGLQGDVAQSLLNLAIVAYWSGDYVHAIEVGTECYSLYRAEGDKAGMGYILETIGMAHFKRNDFSEATQALQESVQLLRLTGDKRGVAMVLNGLGDVARAQGRSEFAAQTYREALQLCLYTGEKRRTAFVLEALAAVLAQNQATLHALELLGAADTLRQAIGTPLYDAERAEYDALLNQLRARVSASEFDNAWQRGQAFTFEQAIGAGLARE